MYLEGICYTSNSNFNRLIQLNRKNQVDAKEGLETMTDNKGTTGRGRNRRSHGGRGGKGYFNNNNKKSTRTKTINDYIYHVGSATQASDYESTTEFLINHIKKTYEYGSDISTALKTLTPWNEVPLRPRLRVCISKPDDFADAESKEGSKASDSGSKEGDEDDAKVVSALNE